MSKACRSHSSRNSDSSNDRDLRMLELACAGEAYTIEVLVIHQMGIIGILLSLYWAGAMIHSGGGGMDWRWRTSHSSPGEVVA